MKTYYELKKELKDVRKTLKTFWKLINSDEVTGIYAFAYNHGVRLSDTHMQKVMPLNKKLKKFRRIK